MKLRRASPTPPIPSTEPAFSTKRIVVAFGIVSLCVAVLIAVIGAAGVGLVVWAGERGHGAFENGPALARSLVQAPGRKWRAAEAPTIYFEIKPKHLEKLRSKRQRALAVGRLFQEGDDFVPAVIRDGDRRIKVKLRLKGDGIDHLMGKKWSFRVHVKRKAHVFGMRRFSLQHPKTRVYQGEVLFFEVLKRVGVLAPRYRFVDVVINGSSIGIMALEEHFSKELLETSGRREGVIVRFDESLYWAAINPEDNVGLPEFNDYRNVPIDVFRSSKVAKSPFLSEQHRVAVGLLRGFTSGALGVSEVFDTELLGRFLAVADLWGEWHSVRWHNQRYYLNPLTMRLEPVVYDAQLGWHTAADKGVVRNEALAVRMLADPAVFESYATTLRQLSNEVLDGSMLDDLRAVERDHLALLDNEFYMLPAYPYETLERRAAYFLAQDSDGLAVSHVAEEKYPLLAHAYLVADAGGSYLEVASAIRQVVEVQSARWVAQDGERSAKFRPASPIAFPLRLSAKPAGAQAKAERIYFSPPPDGADYALQLTVNIKGLPQRRTVQATPYFPALGRNPVPVSTLEAQLARHPFLSLDAERNMLRVRPGRWRVKGSIVVPPGFGLSIAPGTNLQFGADGALIAHGALQFLGSEAAGIRLEGADNGTWQGVAVLNAGARSRWTNVSIRDTVAIMRDGWKLTGGVTFFNSDVDMSQCRFTGSRGEDALNLVQSDFDLVEVTIDDTVSDALDADFASGRVTGGRFRNIGTAGGGDAIDVSGSTVTVTGTRFVAVRDKALSVGEGSEMVATELVIEDVGTGAAAKDGSRLRITGSTITGAEVAGLIAYMKHPEFGAARIEASDVAVQASDVAALAQAGSAILIDGKPVDTVAIDVVRLYETVMKRGPIQ